MHMNILIFYLIGYVLSYLSIRLYFIVNGEEWTIGDRKMSLVLSIFSYFCVFVNVVCIIILWLKNASKNNTPAKW